MANQLRLRRGSSAATAVFTGASGEVTMDQDRIGLVVHDGATPGGMPIPTEAETSRALQSYAALEAYKGRATVVEITTPGIAGTFVRDDSEPSVQAGGAADNGGTIKRDAAGRCWRRRYMRGWVNVRWWGVKGIGPSHDDTPGFRAALAYASASQESIDGGSGHFWITDTLVKPESFFGCNLRFAGPKNAKLDYSSIDVGKPCLLIVGGSGDEVTARVEGVTFVGNDDSIASEVRGQCGQKFRDCRFGQNAIGLLWHNYATGTFTEWCEAESGCVFDLSCKLAQEYRVTAGDESFHGTGIRSFSGNTINQGGDYCTLVGQGARPYNAPFGPQVWVHKPGSALIKCNGHDTVFVGTPTIEGFALGTVVGDTSANTFSLVGGIAGVSKFLLGKCQLAYASSKYGPPDGNVHTVSLHPIMIRKPLVAGDNAVVLPVSAFGMTLVKVRVAGDNYEDRVLLSIDHNGYGQAGSVVKLAQHFQTNVAGYASWPTYRMDADGRLIIGMPALPLGAAVVADIVWSLSTPLQTS